MRKLIMSLAIVTVLATLVAAPAFASDKNSMDSSCGKIEGSQLGVEGTTLEVDGVSVTFTKWVGTSEFFAFDYTVIGGSFTTVSVKASGDVLAVSAGATGTYVQPIGTDGKLHAISNIVFCGASSGGGTTTTTSTTTTTTSTTTTTTTEGNLG